MLLGSVFGKSLRDARGPVVGAIVLCVLFVAVAGAAYALEWDTPAERQALAGQMDSLPAIFQGMLGDAVGVDTLPGFLSWRVIALLPLFIGIWSILALSGTIAGEAQSGSLEMLVALPVSRARIAAQKAAGHVVALTAAMVVAALATVTSTRVLAVLAGDQATLNAALAQYAYVGAMSLMGGAVAFALGPWVSRAAAAGAGGAALYGAFILNGYAELVPAFDRLRFLSVFAWTAGHRPLAGRWDWPPVLAALGLCLALLAAGVVAFVVRDVGRTVRIGGARRFMPAGLGGPLRRSVADRLPSAMAWGVGFGLIAATITGSAGEFLGMFDQVPGLRDMVERLNPQAAAAITSVGGFLQLFFFSFGSLLMALIAATFVGGWAGDEQERRLEMVLAAPITRRRWALKSGLGVLVVLGITTLIVGAAAAGSAWRQGYDPYGPFVGLAVLGLYGAALVGIGLAVGGVFKPGLAGTSVAAVGIGSWALDSLGSFLRLPEAVLNLALVRSLGEPMTGATNMAGVGAAAALALGGLVLGAWGMGRRDLAS